MPCEIVYSLRETVDKIERRNITATKNSFEAKSPSFNQTHPHLKILNTSQADEDRIEFTSNNQTNLPRQAMYSNVSFPKMDYNSDMNHLYSETGKP